MGNKTVLQKRKITDDFSEYSHLDGSRTEVLENEYATMYTHYDRETGNVYQKTEANVVAMVKDAPKVIGGLLLLIPLACIVLGFFALRNSTYTMMATPFMIYQLAMGEGFGWIVLGLCVVPSLLFAFIANRTERAWLVLSRLWAVLLGVAVNVYQVVVLKDPLYIMDVAGDNWIDVVGRYIGTIIHVFMFLMIIQSFTIFLSFTKEHILKYWIWMPVTFVVLNFISAGFQYFGSEYPTDPSRYYEMIDPICRGFGLSEQCMGEALEWLSGFTYNMPLYCLIACGAAAVVWGIYKLVQKIRGY